MYWPHIQKLHFMKATARGGLFSRQSDPFMFIFLLLPFGLQFLVCNLLWWQTTYKDVDWPRVHFRLSNVKDIIPGLLSCSATIVSLFGMSKRDVYIWHVVIKRVGKSSMGLLCWLTLTALPGKNVKKCTRLNLPFAFPLPFTTAKISIVYPAKCHASHV